MKVLAIIPARYASTRFPGKPLAMIEGKSMIRRVYEQCQECRTLSGIIVATDSKAIQTHVTGFGGEVIMTSEHHRSGTERCAEVLNKLSRQKGFARPDVVVNIQGDEPFIEPEQISEVVRIFKDPGVMISTLAKKITSPKDLADPNVVKVVFSDDHRALYFSRSPIPFVRNEVQKKWTEHADFYRHVGIYGYRPEVLERIVQLPASAKETAESLEQLRWLDAGIAITVGKTDYETIAIDTPADLLKITNTKRGKRG